MNLSAIAGWADGGRHVTQTLAYIFRPTLCKYECFAQGHTYKRNE